MSRHKHLANTRRNFLRNMVGAGCASLTLTPFLSGLASLNAMNAIAASSLPLYPVGSYSDYKAMVCIMLSGGNDSFNMLVPMGSNGGSSGLGEHQEYLNARGNMGLAQANLLDIKPLNTDSLSREFGLHPSMDKTRGLFNGTNTNDGERYLSFVANVGSLMTAGMTAANYSNPNYSLPYNLFSHSDQRRSWQTGIFEGNGNTGWAGRMGDLLHSTANNDHPISMNIGLNSSNYFQKGNTYAQYTIQSSNSGSVLLNDSDTNANVYNALKMSAIDNILDVNYQHVLERAYAKKISNAKNNADEFSQAINSLPNAFSYPFPSTGIGQQLEMVAKTIATKDDIGGQSFSRQTFYVVLDGFDSHGDLLSEHQSLLDQLDEAIYAFYKAMKELGSINGDPDFFRKVTGFTMSDFARTIGSNGNGTDHAWGGHSMVFGGEIDAGKIIGQYPNLELNNSPQFLSNGGCFVPTTSCDEYFADLALWFADCGSSPNGFSSLSYQSLKDILPNVDEFIPNTLNQVDNAHRLGLFV